MVVALRGEGVVVVVVGELLSWGVESVEGRGVVVVEGVVGAGGERVSLMLGCGVVGESERGVVEGGRSVGVANGVVGEDWVCGEVIGVWWWC